MEDSFKQSVFVSRYLSHESLSATEKFSLWEDMIYYVGRS